MTIALEDSSEAAPSAEPDTGAVPRETLLSAHLRRQRARRRRRVGLLVGHTTDLQPFAFAVLIAASFLTERIALPPHAAQLLHGVDPIVLLTGLVGGPLAGAVAGAATAIGDDIGDWKRRATYGGLNPCRASSQGSPGSSRSAAHRTPSSAPRSPASPSSSRTSRGVTSSAGSEASRARS